MGSDEATTCFGGEKHTESDSPTSQGEGFLRLRTGIPISSRIPGASLLSLCLFLLLGRPPPPSFRVIFVVIYSSLPFILLLHLSVIYTRLAPSLNFHHSIFSTLFVDPIPVTYCRIFFFYTQTHRI